MKNLILVHFEKDSNYLLKSVKTCLNDLAGEATLKLLCNFSSVFGMKTKATLCSYLQKL